MALLWVVLGFFLFGSSFGCGVPAIDPVLSGLSRIVNGEDAVPGSWPWQVSLQTSSGFHFCGGSLISEDWVVTAAHCGVRKGHLVVAGVSDQGSEEEAGQVLRVAEVFEHPQWDLRAVRNDVALLKLAAPARLSAAVAPVCLPSADTSFPTGSLCTVTGWGKTRYNGRLRWPPGLPEGRSLDPGGHCVLGQQPVCGGPSKAHWLLERLPPLYPPSPQLLLGTRVDFHQTLALAVPLATRALSLSGRRAPPDAALQPPSSSPGSPPPLQAQPCSPRPLFSFEETYFLFALLTASA
ncbi:chymotrypsinogen B-like [Bos indicus]|uniref:Chymotrypsinogen B-like n=1 Tax=Bos indicus TaxID=9915 RepID=A0ABM4QXK9_BOSIN